MSSIQAWRMVPPDSRRIARVLRYSGISIGPLALRLPGCHRLWPAVPSGSSRVQRCRICRPYNPRCITTSGLAFVPVRSPLLGESRLFSFPPGTEMFHFPGFAHSSLCIQPEHTRRSRVGWVAPFGDPGITACERLPLAYRSCPRPS